MIKIGIIDIDTSHPGSFTEILHKGNRARVVALCNTGFRTDEEVKSFMDKHGIKTRVNKIEDLVNLVDIGFVQGCNWDKHIEKAMPFIKANKPVFIDKPIVGNLKDCLKVEKLVKSGTKILGSSSVRYCDEIAEFLKKPKEETGEILSVYGTCGVDEFNYGVHIVEAINGLLGNGAYSVRFVGKNKGVELFQIAYKDGTLTGTGRQVIYQLQTGQWQPFVLVVTTTKKISHFEIDTGKIYASLLNRILDYLEKGIPMASIEQLTETIKVLLAGKKSRESEGKIIKLEDLQIDEPGYDGYDFEKSYAEASKKK